MVAFICVIIWIIVTPCIAVICGLPLKKEKSQCISWKRYSTCMLLVSVFITIEQPKLIRNIRV